MSLEPDMPHPTRRVLEDLGRLDLFNATCRERHRETCPCDYNFVRSFKLGQLVIPPRSFSQEGLELAMHAERGEASAADSS